MFLWIIAGTPSPLITWFIFKRSCVLIYWKCVSPTQTQYQVFLKFLAESLIISSFCCCNLLEQVLCHQGTLSSCTYRLQRENQLVYFHMHLPKRHSFGLHLYIISHGGITHYTADLVTNQNTINKCTYKKLREMSSVLVSWVYFYFYTTSRTNVTNVYYYFLFRT